MASRFTALCLTLSLGVGCSGGDGAKKAAEEADALLRAGDLPGAEAAYKASFAENPDSIDLGVGAAYMALLRGDSAGADQILAGLEAKAGEALPQIKLRRAIALMRGGDLDGAKEQGTASGLPAGKLIAAEVALADGEREDATTLLNEVKDAPGQVGQAARGYLALLTDESPMVVGLSEAQALWVLGERKLAVKSAEELVLSLPDDRADRDSQLLIWAGRAASTGEVAIARSLLDATIFPPEGQAWRKVATQAIAACAEGDGATCTSLFGALDGVAPADGLADAKATAAYLIASSSPEVASQLAGPYVSNGAARALLEAGDKSGALEAVPGGLFEGFLKAGG